METPNWWGITRNHWKLVSLGFEWQEIMAVLRWMVYRDHGKAVTGMGGHFLLVQILDLALIKDVILHGNRAIMAWHNGLESRVTIGRAIRTLCRQGVIKQICQVYAGNLWVWRNIRQCFIDLPNPQTDQLYQPLTTSWSAKVRRVQFGKGRVS